MGNYSDYYKTSEIYAAYKGDELLGTGNLGELAKQLDSSVPALKYNLSDAYKRKRDKIPGNNWRYLIKI